MSLLCVVLCGGFEFEVEGVFGDVFEVVVVDASLYVLGEVGEGESDDGSLCLVLLELCGDVVGDLVGCEFVAVEWWEVDHGSCGELDEFCGGFLWGECEVYESFWVVCFCEGESFW